jgi:autotransporter adhesin
MRGATEFKEILNHFEGKFDGIRGAWSYGDNLAKFNKLTGEGKSLKEAALGTWTGEQAIAAGYAKVTVRSFMGTPGAYTKVDVLFHK